MRKLEVVYNSYIIEMKINIKNLKGEMFAIEM